MPQHLDITQTIRGPQKFVSLVAEATVARRHYQIVALALSACNIGLAVMCAYACQMVLNVKPVVVRIDQVGRAEAINYGNLQYQIRPEEVRYFLTDFVQRHYSRVRANLQDDFTRALYYLDSRTADTVMESNRKSKELETFLASGSEEIRVKVNNVAIEDLRQAPYKATVDFEKQFISPSDPGNPRRERYVGHFVFMIRDRVPNDMIPFNPLGLTITYFREDQAFQ